MQKGDLNGIPGTWLHDKGMWMFHSDEKMMVRRSKAEIARRDKAVAKKDEDPGTGTTRLNADGTVAEDQGPIQVKDPGKFQYAKTRTKRFVKDSSKLEEGANLTPEKFDELTPVKEKKNYH